MSWQGRACLVTGGAGFGGAHLVERLLGLGADVYVLDRWVARSSYFAIRRLVDQVTLVTGDVREVDRLRYLLAAYEIDVVFHLAAQPIVPISNAAPFDTLSINALGTYAVLEAVRTARPAARLVFASSGAYYGTLSSDEEISESFPPRVSTNIYAASKVGADAAVLAYRQVYGLRTVACRFMNTYGPGDINFTRIVPRGIRALMTGADYEFGDRDDGTTELSYMHIADMASAYLVAAERIDDVIEGVVNFGGDRAISTRELARELSLAFDGQPRDPVFRGAPRPKPLRKLLSTERARSALDWKPAIALREGLAGTSAWYRKHWDRLWPGAARIEQDGGRVP
jgi:nucleoside-diphosphate-sugar epimerase